MPVCQFQHQRDNLTIITGNVVVSSISVGNERIFKKEEIMTIILDAMGSDDYPEPEISVAKILSNNIKPNLVLTISIYKSTMPLILLK